MENFIIKEIDSKKDVNLMNQIVEQEDILFGEGSIGSWNVKPFAKYGKIFVVVSNEEVVSAVEILNSFELGKAYVYGVWTNPKYEKRGFAKRLLKYSLECMEKFNIYEFDLTVVCENERAVKLYSNFGFKIIEELEDEYGDGKRRYLMKYTIVK